MIAPCLKCFSMRSTSVFGRLDDLVLLRRHDQVAGGEGKPGQRRLAEAEFLDVVEQLDRALAAQELVAVVNDAVQALLVERLVVVRHLAAGGCR